MTRTEHLAPWSRGAPVGGSPVEPRIRRRVESVTGADCRDVRVHLEGDAQAAAAALGARACTVGRHIYFAAGEYRPHTTDGAQLIAHELVHTIQQGHAVRPQAKPRIGAPVDVHEREADAIADAAIADAPIADAPIAEVGHGSAPPLPVRTHVDAGAVVQRKVFVADRRATFEPPTQHEYGLNDALRQRGEPPRNIGAMVEDHRSRFFENEAELLDFADRKTTDIGYVDREKTWVRLAPNKPLVLGENHAGTTLRDLVEATGHWKYLYEGSIPAERIPHVAAQAEFNHRIEPRLPVMVVGLIGVELRLKKMIEAIKAQYVGCLGFNKSAWKAAHDVAMAAAQPPAADPQANDDAAFEAWSTGWENANSTPIRRKERHMRYYASTHGTVIGDAPPPRGYERTGQEDALTRRVLEYLKDETQLKSDGLTKFYRDHQEIIDTTLVQLGQNKSLAHTRMFRKMVTGKFDLSALRVLLETEAEKAFESAAIEDVSAGQVYDGEIETDEQGRRMEALRDSYMLDEIVKAYAAGVRLFGLGDLHRRNLHEKLKQKIVGVEVIPSDDFYRAQYTRHTDRD